MLDLLLSERSSTLSFSGRQKSFRNAWIFLFTNTVPSFFLFYDLSCLSNQWGCCLIVFLDAANNTAFRVIPLWVYWGWYNMFTSNNKHNTFYFFLGILQSTRMCAVLEFLVAAHILTSNVDSMCCKHMSNLWGMHACLLINISILERITRDRHGVDMKIAHTRTMNIYCLLYGGGGAGWNPKELAINFVLLNVCAFLRSNAMSLSWGQKALLGMYLRLSCSFSTWRQLCLP